MATKLAPISVLAAAAAVAAAVLSDAGAPLAADLRRPSGVIELFTSQGCSSCPPADRVLSEIAGKGDVLALGWHVDYWDYLGWKDTFGLPQATKRQRAYAASFGSRGIYTPQAVINGRADIVGSRGRDVVDALSRMAGTDNGLTVDIDALSREGMLEVSVSPGPQATGAVLWMVYYDRNETVSVEAGENRGHSIEYANVVRDFEMIGMVGEQALKANFPLADLARRGFDACALVLQTKKEGMPGPIVGALVISDLSR